MCKEKEGGSAVEKHIREKEKGGRDDNLDVGRRETADLYSQVCVMMPWVIFQITSNHSVPLCITLYSGGIRGEESKV